MPMSSSQPIALLAAACLLIVAPQAAALSPTAAVPAPASSVPTTVDAKSRRVDRGPSFARAMVIADSWVTGHGLVNTCAGKLQISWVANPQDADGQIDGWSDGWVWTGEAFAWDTSRCQIGIRTGMSRTKTCGVLGHELMHAVRGAEHSGPLPSTRTVPPDCGMWKQRPRKLRITS